MLNCAEQSGPCRAAVAGKAATRKSLHGCGFLLAPSVRSRTTRSCTPSTAQGTSRSMACTVPEAVVSTSRLRGSRGTSSRCRVSYIF